MSFSCQFATASSDSGMYRLSAPANGCSSCWTGCQRCRLQATRNRPAAPRAGKWSCKTSGEAPPLITVSNHSFEATPCAFLPALLIKAP